ncbi:hypothetical protein CHGG_10101 [Chaetomium globosum CBS 148.51]|uniref:Uncharacterized protein n=1 Tax=Chaetomium globosum (strain ATCC 6205 / CBS 148.51 / DSM 1962 / NBRC 6347 / NRRL 1970) TaxID=306901 RepID=Q2GPK3_CHAGB|nr:uncharacterized protein CHGG_10101 [Chaetomium globosum CBS 148.51]EAQ83697.1 hypothetical protein CHGG_10101 [Chaetomium globosum CBS 148.51]
MSSEAEAQTRQQPTIPVDTGSLRAVLVFGADHYVGEVMVIAALCREIEMSGMAYVVNEVQEPMDFIKRHAPEPGDDRTVWVSH